MRRQDREIKDPSVILDIIHTLPIGHLAMSDAGTPYGVTMNFFSELDADRNAVLYFHGAKEGRKAEILTRDPHVYFFAERDDGPKVIVRPNGTKSVTNHYVSVASEGVMELVEDVTEKRRVLLGMANAFSDEPIDSIPDDVVDMTAVWKLVLHSMTGKSNPPLTPSEQ